MSKISCRTASSLPPHWLAIAFAIPQNVFDLSFAFLTPLLCQLSFFFDFSMVGAVYPPTSWRNRIAWNKPWQSF
jgi:hypothetical protein